MRVDEPLSTLPGVDQPSDPQSPKADIRQPWCLIERSDQNGSRQSYGLGDFGGLSIRDVRDRPTFGSDDSNENSGLLGAPAMSKQDVREFAQRVQIPYLLHFTRAANLPSIIEHGLYPVSRTCEIGVVPQVNDHHRFDGHRSATSLSIGFPNYRMFYKLRTENPGVNWVVLGIAASVLWTKDCAFCRHNAADARISKTPLELLQTVEALAAMFEEIDGFQSRAEQQLKAYDPTDGQAEVLVFDVIEPNLILGAVFDSDKVRDHHAASLGTRQVIVNPPNKGYFASRPYVRTPRQ